MKLHFVFTFKLTILAQAILVFICYVLAPTYNAPFTARHNISAVEMRWENTFSLNSLLVRYEVEDRGENVYVGINSYFYLRRTSAQGWCV